MKFRLIRKVISAILMAAMLLPMVVVSAYAGGPTKSPSPADLSPQEQIALNEARQAEMEQAIVVLEPYVVRNEDGTFSLLIDNPKKVGVSPEAFAQLKTGMEHINKLVRDGVLVTDENLDVRPANDQSSCSDNHQAVFSTGCPGHTFFEWHWWGYSLHLDHCKTNDVIYLLSIGTIAGGFVTWLTSIDVIPGDEVIAVLAEAIVAAKLAKYDWADNERGCGSVTNVIWGGFSWVTAGTC